MNEFNGTSFIENIHDTPQYKEMLIRHGIDPSDPYKEKEQPRISKTRMDRILSSLSEIEERELRNSGIWIQMWKERSDGISVNGIVACIV